VIPLLDLPPLYLTVTTLYAELLNNLEEQATSSSRTLEGTLSLANWRPVRKVTPRRKQRARPTKKQMAAIRARNVELQSGPEAVEPTPHEHETASSAAIESEGQMHARALDLLSKKPSGAKKACFGGKEADEHWAYLMAFVASSEDAEEYGLRKLNT
jgi:hypothetical protein